MKLNVQRVLEIGGLVVMVIGFIYWYGTPRGVIVGPLLVILIGVALALLGGYAGRLRDEAAVNALIEQLRQERGASPADPAVPGAGASGSVSAGVTSAASTAVTAITEGLAAVQAKLSESFGSRAQTPTFESRMLPMSQGAVAADAVTPPPPTAPVPSRPQSVLPAAIVPPPPPPPPQAARSAVVPSSMTPRPSGQAAVPPPPRPDLITSIPGTTSDGDERDDLEATRSQAPGALVDWAVELPDGRRIGITGTLLLGRDPAADASSPNAVLVSIDELGKSISKTHLRLQAHSEGPGISDLHSTNGTWFVRPDGSEERLLPTLRYQLIDSSRIRMGDVVLQVVHRDGTHSGT